MTELHPAQASELQITPAAEIVVERHRYQIVFAIEGRIRFLSHLETVDTLLSALRRTGVRFALSQGMKPKPLIKVAMPRPVAVEAWSDIVEVELTEMIDPDEFALALTATLPVGLTLQTIRRLDGAYASAASRVAGATFRVHLHGDVSEEQLTRWVAGFRASDSIIVPRRTPKQHRDVDVRSVVADMTVVPGDPPAVRFYTRLTDEGSAKPEEVIRALTQIAGHELKSRRTIRESITLAEPGGDGRTADPALVGADVPDGPAKPWGAC